MSEEWQTLSIMVTVRVFACAPPPRSVRRRTSPYIFHVASESSAASSFSAHRAVFAGRAWSGPAASTLIGALNPHDWTTPLAWHVWHFRATWSRRPVAQITSLGGEAAGGNIGLIYLFLINPHVVGMAAAYGDCHVGPYLCWLLFAITMLHLESKRAAVVREAFCALAASTSDARSAAVMYASAALQLPPWRGILFPSWERWVAGLNVIEEKQDCRPVSGGPLEP